jgi:hypothetical protein
MRERVDKVSKDSYKDEKELLDSASKKAFNTFWIPTLRKDAPMILKTCTQGWIYLRQTFRGTPDVETYHETMKAIFSSVNCGPEYMFYRWQYRKILAKTQNLLWTQLL